MPIIASTAGICIIFISAWSLLCQWCFNASSSSLSCVGTLKWGSFLVAAEVGNGRAVKQNCVNMPSLIVSPCFPVYLLFPASCSLRVRRSPKHFQGFVCFVLFVMCLTRFFYAWPEVLTLTKHVFCLETLCEEKQNMQKEKCTASEKRFFSFFSVLPHAWKFSMWDL